MFSDNDSLDIFIDFFQTERRFPRPQDIIIVSKPEIPVSIKTDEIISNQKLDGINQVSENALSEFLHNMSHQALNIKNDNNWVKFDATAQLIDNIKHVLIQRN